MMFTGIVSTFLTPTPTPILTLIQHTLITPILTLIQNPNSNPIQTLIQSLGIVDHYGVREREIDAGLDQFNNLFFSLNARKVGR